jgi:hypothetical protein
MKKIFYLSLVMLAVTITVMVACKKDVEGRTDNTPALQPANTDINAGAWRPILLTGPTEFPVATPIATNTRLYRPGQ